MDPLPERPTGATLERQVLPVSAPRPRGPVLIRGWSGLHLGGFALLLAVAAASAAVIYGELTAEPPVPVAASEPSGASALPAPPAQEPVFAMPPLQSYAEVTERPLFSPSRRPATVTLQMAGPSSSLALVGVVISRDGGIALIRSGKGPALARVREGQQVEGWTVRSIAPDRVVVRNGTSEAQLKLHDDAPAAKDANSQSAQ
ncbi:MAG TPA: type II secretion system protein N [Stellaceae bacterium]|nr:type II secretion system protein N [Stellaceae bacterium]